MTDHHLSAPILFNAGDSIEEAIRALAASAGIEAALSEIPAPARIRVRRASDGRVVYEGPQWQIPPLALEDGVTYRTEAIAPIPIIEDPTMPPDSWGVGYDEPHDSPLAVHQSADIDGEYLLYFLRDGATFKCGYVFENAVEEVRGKLADRDLVELRGGPFIGLFYRRKPGALEHVRRFNDVDYVYDAFSGEYRGTR